MHEGGRQMRPWLRCLTRRTILMAVTSVLLAGCSAPVCLYRIQISDPSPPAKGNAIVSVQDWTPYVKHRRFSIWTNEIPCCLQFEFPSRRVRVVALSSDGCSMFQGYVSGDMFPSIFEVRLNSSDKPYLFKNLEQELDDLPKGGQQIFPRTINQ